MRFRFIKLQWNEHDKSAEYTLKFNGTKRGLWIGTEPPRGKRTKQPKIYVACIPSKWVNRKCKFRSLFSFLAGSVLRKHLLHTHYTGTVQVMKAVGNHLVLTFCEKTELFTIILTRTKNVFAVDVSVKSPDDYVEILIFIKCFQMFLFFFRMLSPFTLCWTGEVSQFKRFENCVGTIQRFTSQSIPHLCSRWWRCF